MPEKLAVSEVVTKKLLAKVEAGDADARRQLKRGLVRAEGPEVEALTSPSRRLEGVLVKRVSPDPTNSALFEAHAERLRADLAGPAPSPLERLLVERIVVCWLLANQLDLADACAGNRSLVLAEYEGKRADRAHRRFLAAVKTLAEVRRLAAPSLQVNIAERQVNVGTLSAPAPTAHTIRPEEPE